MHRARIVFIALALGLTVVSGCRAASQAPSVITGRVVSLEGDPISGASVRTPAAAAISDGGGWFAVAAKPLPQWVTVDHPDFLSRTRAGAQGTPLLLRLTPDDGETIALQFAGDVMFGRRYYDPNEDGDRSDSLLPVDALTSGPQALLSGIRPLLENADLTVVNLESPLASDAESGLDQIARSERIRGETQDILRGLGMDPGAGLVPDRPAGQHQTKDFVFASDPAVASALRHAGVDVVDIGNNHVTDLLEAGLSDTIDALARAGLTYFGAGQSEAAAWAPGSVSVRGQSIAFVGCTTISGLWHPVSYVASDAANKGGAAHCSEPRLRQAVAEAAVEHDIVIAMIHGGWEYERNPSPTVRRFTAVAREAGATLVINHHPHVAAGLDWDGASLAAWSLGNLFFDQTVWPTFESYVLVVHLRQGEVVRAYAEPLLIEGFVPTGVTGDLADFVARGAAGRTSGPFIVENGALESDLTGLSVRQDTRTSVDGGGAPGTIVTVPAAQWVSAFTGAGSVRLGRDLLWVGGFEGEAVDVGAFEAPLWELGGPDKAVDAEAAHGGSAGARLTRTARNVNDVVLAPLHRMLIQPGVELSLVGMVRASPGAAVTVQLSWYPDTRGASNRRTIEPVGVLSSGEWAAFRLDVAAPADAVAVGLFLRLAPPEAGSASVDFDDLRVIEWAPPGAAFNRQYDSVRLTGPGEITFSRDVMPGAEFLAAPRASDRAPGSPAATSQGGGTRSGARIGTERNRQSTRRGSIPERTIGHRASALPHSPV